jgi:hypothetical protein
MNYTKIKIDDKEYGLKYGMLSARYLAEKLQNPYCFNGEEITEIGIAYVVYAGYINNCAIKDIKPELTLERVVDFVEGSVKDADKVTTLTDVIELWVSLQLTPTKEPETKKKTLRKSKS